MGAAERTALLVLKVHLSELSDESRQKTQKTHDELKAIVDAAGAEGILALVQLGLEIQSGEN